jgi:hypothetical protein
MRGCNKSNCLDYVPLMDPKELTFARLSSPDQNCRSRVRQYVPGNVVVMWQAPPTCGDGAAHDLSSTS